MQKKRETQTIDNSNKGPGTRQRRRGRSGNKLRPIYHPWQTNTRTVQAGEGLAQGDREAAGREEGVHDAN